MTQSLWPVEGFESLETHHCITGSIQHVYVFNQHPLSEDLLLGIGGGVGFIYWHQKGQMPFIGGRGKGSPAQAFEGTVGERTGVLIEDHSTSSARKARRTLLQSLAVGQPVMMYVDMGFLPYFDFGGEEYHFGGHMVVACGWDEETEVVLLADRDTGFHMVPMSTLELARGSTHKPFPPQNRWFSTDFTHKRFPLREEFCLAIKEQVDCALNPPITNMGVPGIQKAAKQLIKWPEVLDEDLLRMTMFNAYLFIDAAGGTGGGIFRYMFSRFLLETAEVLGQSALNQIAAEFKEAGDRWQEVAMLFKQDWEHPNPASVLTEISQRMLGIAEMEKSAWSNLGKIIKESENGKIRF